MNFQRVSEGLHLKLGFRLECISADTCLWSPSLHFCPNSFLETCLKYTFCIYRYTRKVCSQVLTDTRALSSGAGTGVLGDHWVPWTVQLAHLVGCERQRLHCLLSVEEIAFDLVTWYGFLRSNGQGSMSPTHPWKAFSNGISLTRKRKV